MFFLIIAILATLAGIAILFSKQFAKKTKWLSLITFAIAVLCLGRACVTTIDTGHTGVVTVFGKVQNYTLDSGLHVKAPWQNVIQMDNRVQKVSLDLEGASSDIQAVQMLYTVNYKISKTNAQEIYSTIGVHYYDTIISPNIAEAVKVATAKFTAEELINKRSELTDMIQSDLSTRLANYNIEVVSCALENLEFARAFMDAVEAKQVAAQNKLQAEIEQAQKTMEKNAEAERQVIEAEAAAKVAKIQAEADLEVTKIQADAAEYAGQKEAAKNKAISAALTKDLIQYYYIQQWDGKLPETYAGDGQVSVIMGMK